jgi:hypothetical protein
MEIEIVKTCPLGSVCEEAKDGKIYRCEWYVKLEGDSPQDGKKLETSKCAIAWEPILLIEGNLNSFKTTSAIHSFRNETLVRQDKAIGKINELQISSDT